MHESLARDRIHVTVDLLILTVREGRLNLLLAQRVDPPYAGRWALPGRFVGLNESARGAARELLREMLPVEGAYIEQLYTFTRADRDPRGRVISVSYLVVVPWTRLAPALDRADARLKRFEPQVGDGPATLLTEDGAAIRGEDLAFDHGRIVETGILRVRGKIDYTDIGFAFLDDTSCFTLSALTTIYEAVLNRSVDVSNFRRAIRTRYELTGRMTQTDQSEKRKRGRPAALYRLNEPDRGGMDNEEYEG